jgi:hypothetical protein
MTADRFLRLYPRAWRERYGDEFLALVGDRPLGFPQLIDIVSGAIDAHLSSDVRATTTSRKPAVQSEGGAAVIETWKPVCLRDRPAVFSKRDAGIGAAVVVGGSILFSALGIGLRRAGLDALGEGVISAGFPVSVLLTLPFTFVKGQPWKAQGVLVGIPILIVVLLTYIATKL